MRLLLFLILVFQITNACSQPKSIYSGFYVDSFKYHPDKTDTFKFEFYYNGFLRLMEDKQYIEITDLSNIDKNKINFTIYIDKFSRSNDYDSFKTIYHYKGDNHFKSTHFQKLAFRESGGCFRYENKRASYWYQTGISTFEYDTNYNCIKQTSYSEIDQWRDTSKYRNIITYNDDDSIKEMKTFRSDTLYNTIRYEYKTNYKKSETFSFKNELIHSVETFTLNNKIIKTIESHKYGAISNVEKTYFYNDLGLLIREESYSLKASAPKDRFLVRHYYYD